MSLGLTIISVMSGMIAALGLYIGGHVSLAGGLGAYSATGVIVALILSTSFFLEASFNSTRSK